MTKITRSLPNNEYQAAVNANNPSASNPFATMDQLGGGVPKTAFISKDGDDSTGKLEDPSKPFATFMGAYNKILTEIAAIAIKNSIWKIEYVGNVEGGDTEFIENDIYLDHATSHMLEELVVHVPSGVRLTCDTSNDKALFERSTNNYFAPVTLRITGYGSFERTGSPTNIYKAGVFITADNRSMNIIIDSAKEIINRVGWTCITNYTTVNNVDLIKSYAGKVAYADREIKLKNIGLIVSELETLHIVLENIEIENCIIESYTKNTSHISNGYKLKNSKFISNFGTTNLETYYIEDIEECEFINNFDADEVSNIYITSTNAVTFKQRLTRCKFYIANPKATDTRNNITFKTTLNQLGILDAEIIQCIFNKGIYNLLQTVPVIVRRTIMTPVNVGNIFVIRLADYNESASLSSHILLSFTATTTSAEDVIDELISLWEAHALANPDSAAYGFNLTKGFDGTYWYLESQGINITYRENPFAVVTTTFVEEYMSPSGVLGSIYAGMINIIDMENLNNNVLISSNFGLADDEITHDIT